MDRIGIIGENSIEYVEKIFDVWEENKTVVLIDWRIPLEKAFDMLKDIGVSTIYMEESLYNKSHRDNCISYKDRHQKVMEIPSYIYNRFQPNYSDKDALILFSSGTTGKSKGIRISHKAINENIDGIASAICLKREDTLLVAKALAHSSSIIGELLLGIKYRCKTILVRTSTLPNTILKAMDYYKVTYTFMNPSLLKIFTKAAKKYTFTNLKAIYVYGAKAQRDIIEDAQKIFKYTEILCGYGQTEAGPRVTMQLQGRDNVAGSAGAPIKNVEVAIVGKDGEKKKVGEKGIIHINTPSRFSGYVNQIPERTSYYNNWLNSGDVGYLDENNNLYVVGRDDNSCLVGAHIVYLEEVEDKVNTYIGIDDCVAICVQDATYGNRIDCYYTGEIADEKKLRRYLKDLLAPYEIPQKFIHMEKLPMTINGKKRRYRIEKREE